MAEPFGLIGPAGSAPVVQVFVGLRDAEMDESLHDRLEQGLDPRAELLTSLVVVANSGLKLPAPGMPTTAGAS
jgi:hypothetical protein